MRYLQLIFYNKPVSSSDRAIHQEIKTSCRDQANQYLHLQCVNPSSRKINYQVKIDLHTARMASSSLGAWMCTDQKNLQKAHTHTEWQKSLYKVRKAHIWKRLPMLFGRQQEAITLGWKSINTKKTPLNKGTFPSYLRHNLSFQRMPSIHGIHW